MQEDRPLSIVALQPAGSVEQLTAMWDQYQRLKSCLLDKSDFQQMGDKEFVKKSGWRKLGTAFALTDEITDKEIHRDQYGRPEWATFTVRATHPGGRSAEGTHGCNFREKCCPAAFGEACNKQHDHCKQGCSGWHHWSHPDDVMATAHTRSKNRAISDLVGGGEVSAEELDAEAVAAEQKARRNFSGAIPEHYCMKHQVNFRRYEKNGRVWYSHKDGDGWCNEPKAPEGTNQHDPITRAYADLEPHSDDLFATDAYPEPQVKRTTEPTGADHQPITKAQADTLKNYADRADKRNELDDYTATKLDNDLQRMRVGVWRKWMVRLEELLEVERELAEVAVEAKE